MAVNKVVYNGETLVDLTADSAAPENTLSGVTGHRANGEAYIGVIPKVAGGIITPSTQEQLAVAAGSYVMNDIIVAAASGGATTVEITLSAYSQTVNVPWPTDALPKYVLMAALDDGYEDSATTKELYIGSWRNIGGGKAYVSGVSRRLTAAGVAGWHYYAMAPNSATNTEVSTYAYSLSDGVLKLGMGYASAGKRKYIVIGINAD